MSAVEREEIALVGDEFAESLYSEVDVDESLAEKEGFREGSRGEPREKRDPLEDDACVEAEKIDGRVFEEVGYTGLVGLAGSDGPAVRRDALLGVLGEEARFVLMLLGAPRRGPESTDLLRRSLRGESSLESPETKRAPEPRLPSSSFGVG